MCAYLSLTELARLATVSKLWDQTYKARLSAEQQRLKALVAEAPPGPSSGAPRQPLLAALPNHRPPSPTPPIPGLGCWTPYSPLNDHKGPIKWGCEPSCLFSDKVSDYESSFSFNLCGCVRIRWFPGTTSRHCKRLSVKACAGTQEELSQVLGLLLHLLQDLLPRLHREHRQRSGKIFPFPTVDVECTLSFESGCSMWAPFLPLLRELRAYPTQVWRDRIVINFDGNAFCCGKRERIVFSGAGKPPLDVDLTVRAPSWGA